MVTESSLSEFIIKNRNLNLQNFSKEIKIAVLGSFTLNGLKEVLRVKCSDINVNAKIYSAPYNQINQEILNKKGYVYEFNPDITFLILDTRSILGDVFFLPYSINKNERKILINNKIAELSDLIDIFTSTINSKLVISNLSIPNYSPNGICETKTEYGLQQMIHEFNQKLLEISSQNHSLYIYDFNGFVNRYGEKNTFDFHQYYSADIKISFEYIPYLCHDFMGYVKAVLGMNRKCIVLDLDNTLWGGVVGEDEINGIKLGLTDSGRVYYEFQKYLKSLQQRGIILAINSKNNSDDALEVIRNHPYMVLKEQDFACQKINWNDKISNMKEIARELNIGLDSIVFLDDDPVNRELMMKTLPEILTVDLPVDPTYFISRLLALNDFNVLSITEEDTNRGTMYYQQKQRKEFESTTNLDDFLTQLDIKIKILPCNEFTIPRISQLTLKTNQFNLTTKRYQEEDIRRFSTTDTMIVGCAQVEDKFGDNGLTGVFIISKKYPDIWYVDTFLLSCRIMGRGIENTILSYIINEAKKNNVKKILAQYIPTKKNTTSKKFLEDAGFEQEGDYWAFDTNKQFKASLHDIIIHDG